MTYLFLILGFALLILGAEFLVKGASRAAGALGIPSLIIGLTVVAFGTSAPEMAVNIISAISGQGDIGFGNVVGSNIFNVLFILGISAIIIPLQVSKQLIKIDVPLMIVVSFVMMIMALDGKIGMIDGIILFGTAVAYTIFLIREGKKDNSDPQTNDIEAAKSSPLKFWITNIGFVIFGIGLLILGSRWLVNSSIEIARAFNVSELIIGLTIIAAGTSLPEVATSVVASIKGERDIAVGNVVGSNIFNILLVLGLSSILSGSGIPVNDAALNFDVPVMIAVAVACLPIFFTGNLIDRWEGILFLVYYIIYTGYLVLSASEHDSINKVSLVMGYFVIPLTVITLAIISYRSYKKQKVK